MKKIVCLVWLTASFFYSRAQLQPIGSWREHLPYHQAIAVSGSSNQIFAATPYSVFSVQLLDNSLHAFSKMTGLSATGVSTIAFDVSTNKLIIAYLNSDIDRKEVASYLNIPPHIFSAFVSQAYGANFNDVINRHRIKYIEEGLKNEKWNELTLETIAEKAGFNNRVTFLTAFKKFTGTTPTQYIKNIQVQKTSAKFNEKAVNKFVQR